MACCLEWVKKDKVANPDAVVFDPRPWTRIVGLAPDGNHVLVASDTYNLILARILGSQPQPLEEADLELATKTLQQLLFRAAGARQSHTYSPLEMEQAIRDREEWILSGLIEAPDVLAVANKWRHWKPGKIKTQLPTSQRALEQHLRARWLERLLGYFIPFRHQIPYMHDARFRTIRAHCLAYEGMRKIGFQNRPWTAGDVRHLMNQAVTLEVTPAKLQKWWGTVKWLSIKLGMLNVDEHKQLLEKRKAIQETLVDTQTKPQRKAVVPTRAIVWALEQGAEGTPPENRVPELTKAVDRYIMAMARFNLACSARFNDVQHTERRFPGPRSFLEHPDNAVVSSSLPKAKECSSFWITEEGQLWMEENSLTAISFDQCRLGQLVKKATTLATDLPIQDWDQMRCTHQSHVGTNESSTLSRYPWDMMAGLAKAIAVSLAAPGHIRIPSQFPGNPKELFKGRGSDPPEGHSPKKRDPVKEAVPPHHTRAQSPEARTPRSPVCTGSSTLRQTP